MLPFLVQFVDVPACYAQQGAKHEVVELDYRDEVVGVVCPENADVLYLKSSASKDELCQLFSLALSTWIRMHPTDFHGSIAHRPKVRVNIAVDFVVMPPKDQHLYFIDTRAPAPVFSAKR